ncbi:MAG: FAD-binding oxidoreductase [Thermoflexales bacterium]|nr:FAD-binding oxidoreductase [Thermoflexales bacterium]
MPNSFDVLIAGGGVMGCAIATYLKRFAPTLRVAVIERDVTYARNSTVLSDGNTRVQFNLPENIRMSQYGLEVMATFADEMAVAGERPDIGFRQQGNLFIVDASSREECEEGLATQRGLGADVVWLSITEVARRWPAFALDASMFAGATFGRQDGTLSPHAVLIAYRRKAQALGVQMIDAEIVAITTQQGSVTGLRLADGSNLRAPIVVNAAGAWAARLAASAGVALPVDPVKRQVFVLETALRPAGVLPALFLPSGLYVIHEGEGRFTVGKSYADDPVRDDDFTLDDARFAERLWPELAELLPGFDRLRQVGGWAGLYEVNTLDGNALLGPWPTLPGMFCANGFSGHGFQQCHAVGRHLAELILGKTPTLDLRRFAAARVLEGRPVFESRRRII